MLLLKSSDGGVGGTSDVADRRMMDDDDDEDDDCSSDMVLPASTPTRGIRNFFRKRHKSVGVGSVDVVISSKNSSKFKSVN